MRVSILALAVPAFAWTLSSGCMMAQGLNPEARLQDHVMMLNDEARWGRVDLASARCTRDYRQPFVRSHRRWGRGISIGDVDVTNIAMLQDGALSLVTYQWIDEATMELHSTTVRQSWVGEGEGFVLSREDIVDGDAQLYLEVDGGPRRLSEVDAASFDADGMTAGGSDTTERTVRDMAPSRRDAQGVVIR